MPFIQKKWCLLLGFLYTPFLLAQDNPIYRIAKIKIDPSKTQQYFSALKTQMNAAIQKEKGVLGYYALHDKKDSSAITILEIYADSAAYKAHINTPHFKTYKDTSKNIVQSLQLIDLDLIAKALQPSPQN